MFCLEGQHKTKNNWGFSDLASLLLLCSNGHNSLRRTAHRRSQHFCLDQHLHPLQKHWGMEGHVAQLFGSTYSCTSETSSQSEFPPKGEWISPAGSCGDTLLTGAQGRGTPFLLMPPRKLQQWVRRLLSVRMEERLELLQNPAGTKALPSATLMRGKQRVSGIQKLQWWLRLDVLPGRDTRKTAPASPADLLSQRRASALVMRVGLSYFPKPEIPEPLPVQIIEKKIRGNLLINLIHTNKEELALTSDHEMVKCRILWCKAKSSISTLDFGDQTLVRDLL